jgi:elongation factor G
MLAITILAHVDAGKTTLCERILWLGGTIRNCGEVEEGLATMDYLPEEQERGITIETGVERVEWRGRSLQLLDTPGHVDFAPEVEASLAACDGAVLLISGVRHLQTRTWSAWRQLEENRVPTLIFVNRLDQEAADWDGALAKVKISFGRKPVLFSSPVRRDGALAGVIDHLSSRWIRQGEAPGDVVISPIPEECLPEHQLAREDLIMAASEHQPELLERWVATGDLPAAEWVPALAERVRRCEILPVYAGSARTAAGVRQLMNGMTLMFERNGEATPGAARVVRARWHPNTGRWFLVRALGILSQGDLPGELAEVHAGELAPIDAVEPGALCALSCQKRWTPGTLLISGATETEVPPLEQREETTQLETVLQPESQEDQQRIVEALDELTATDPGLQVRIDQENGLCRVRTLGEVHLDVAVERIRRDFKAKFRLGDPQVVLREQWCAAIEGVELIQQMHERELRLRLSFLPASHEGVVWQRYGDCEQPELVDLVIATAVTEFAHAGLRGRGAISGLRIHIEEIDMKGRMLPGLLKKGLTDLFRLRLPLESVEILEPEAIVEVWTPPEYQGAVASDLVQRGGKIGGQDVGPEGVAIEATLPLRNSFGYAVDLRSITRGRGFCLRRRGGWIPLASG